MPEESKRTVTIPIFGFRSRQTSLIVSENDTLADVRESIRQWSLEDVQRLVLGDNPTNDESMISGFSFHVSDGSKISASEEHEIRAASFRATGCTGTATGTAELHVRANRPSSPPQTLKGLLWVFSLAVLGWTPPVWFRIRDVQQKFASSGSPPKQQLGALVVAFLFVLLFFLDLADALVDLLVAFQDLIEGTEGNRAYGILLGTMTILARLLAGWYGVAHHRVSARTDTRHHGPVRTFLVATYFFVELSVFLMEDGAAILYLANTHREDDLLTRINTFLTSACGIAFVCYNLCSMRTVLESLTTSVTTFQILSSGHTERRIGVVDRAACKRTFVSLLFLLSFGFAVAMVVLLVQQVWRKDVGVPFSEHSTVWTIVYGCGVAVCVPLALGLIRTFDHLEEIALARRSELDEYRTAFGDPHATKIPTDVVQRTRSLTTTPQGGPAVLPETQTRIACGARAQRQPQKACVCD